MVTRWPFAARLAYKGDTFLIDFTATTITL